MTWQPLSEEQLLDDINKAWKRMSPDQRRVWEWIKIDPEKWVEHSYGDEGGGFWVVALAGKQCLFYNDIEDGYNWSDYIRYGEIKDYWCNQDELEWAVQWFINGRIPARVGGPQPGSYKM